MNSIRWLRCTVFHISQSEMAAIAGVRQGTVSRWEAGQFAPSLDHLRRIRTEARRRGLPWDDRWFFDEQVA